jgi:hypothetical protein
MGIAAHRVSVVREEAQVSKSRSKGYVVSHIDEIDPLHEKDPTAGGKMLTTEWRPIRHHFGIGSFGVNLFRSMAAGETLTSLHDETDTGHEELFFVAQGDARFSVGGDEFDAPAGTFVFVADPAALRAAWAQDAGALLLVVGGKPGTAYGVQDWELEEFGPEG